MSEALVLSSNAEVARCPRHFAKELDSRVRGNERMWGFLHSLEGFQKSEQAFNKKQISASKHYSGVILARRRISLTKL